MQTGELAQLIKSRRSIRQWEKRKVPEELLLQAIELATYAPNGGNQQNWRFFIVLKPETIRTLGDIVQNSAGYIASLPAAAKYGDMAVKMLQRSSFFQDAPALIAVATSRYQSQVDLILEESGKTDARSKQMREWRNTADTRVQSVSSAIAYLLLVLHQMGLGAVWMTGPIQAKGDIEKLLKVPSEMDVIALLPVGYPAESPEVRERKPVKDVCEIIR
jgi:nitroreductase